MTKVVPLFGGGLATEPNEGIIEDIQELLVRAKRGEIRAIAWTRMNMAGDISTGWNGDAGTRNGLGFAVNVLCSKYVERALECTEPEPAFVPEDDGA
jgi:hypothetical protein